MTRAIILLLLLLVGRADAATDARRLTLHFAYADHGLEPSAREALAAFLLTCDRSSEHELVLQGHTDGDGRAGYNQELGLRRAMAVRAALIELGVPEGLITLRSAGEDEPVAANTDPEGMQRNRRVEVVFNRYVLEDLRDLQGLLGNDRVHTWTVGTDAPQWLRTPQGAAVHVPAHAFRDAQGRLVEGAVDITITEAMALEDILAEGLSTVSGTALIETGGMLKVEASAAGSPVTLDAQASLLVSLPTKERAADMQLFVSGTGTDWQATGRRPLSKLKLELPAPPRFRWPAMNYTAFVPDLAGKPREPLEPWCPIEPTAPRRESYTTRPRWYHFVMRERIRANDEARYTAALEAHALRVAKYEAKLRAYEEDKAAYPERMAAYEQAMDRWNEEVLPARYEEWRTSVLVPAQQQYRARLRVAEQRYADELAVWTDRNRELLDRHAAQMDSLGLDDVALFNTYLFATNTLGWINCDRFMDVPAAQKHDIIVQDADTARKNVFLVFSDIHSIARMTPTEAGYLQPAIPRNEAVELFAYAVKDGRPYVCRAPMTGKARGELKMERTTVAGLRKLMADLQVKG